MTPPHRFTIETLQAHTALPRIALAFSRRRMAIQRLQMEAQDTAGYALLEIEARCDRQAAARCARQLERIVEVTQVQIRELEPDVRAQPEQRIASVSHAAVAALQ